jgi:voltage-gated potassium channel
MERWLDRELGRVRTPRGAAIVIAVVTTTITIASGFLMRAIDHKEFKSVGQGLWWAVQTVTTVGYGDHVPETAPGQILAAGVMLVGIGFVTVITAAITSAFVARAREQEASKRVPDYVHQINERLDRIEKALNSGR